MIIYYYSIFVIYTYFSNYFSYKKYTLVYTLKIKNNFKHFIIPGFFNHFQPGVYERAFSFTAILGLFPVSDKRKLEHFFIGNCKWWYELHSCKRIDMKLLDVPIAIQVSSLRSIVEKPKEIEYGIPKEILLPLNYCTSYCILFQTKFGSCSKQQLFLFKERSRYLQEHLFSNILFKFLRNSLDTWDGV